MRVFGVDCGTEFTGYGVVEVDNASRLQKLGYLCAGAVKLNKKDHTPVRLAQVYAELTALMQLWQPDVVAIEEVFFSANAKSALKLGQVRGVALRASGSRVRSAFNQERRCGLRTRRQGAGAVHGGAAAGTRRSSQACGCGRRSGYCDLPHPPCADG
jgi:crossover junction endodeoxyribonuclease RuvC